MYRAYSADEVPEIIPYADSIVGYGARNVKAEWHPKANPTAGREQDGMRVLTKLPPAGTMFLPQGFEEGFAACIRGDINKIQTTLCAKPALLSHAASWAALDLIFPKCDDSTVYVRDYPAQWKVPFASHFSRVFSGVATGSMQYILF